MRAAEKTCYNILLWLHTAEYSEHWHKGISVAEKQKETSKETTKAVLEVCTMVGNIHVWVFSHRLDYFS